MIYGQRLFNNFTFEYALGFKRILINNIEEQWKSINKKHRGQEHKYHAMPCMWGCTGNIL